MNIPVRDAPFCERLAERMLSLHTRLVVGLDPVFERLPTALRALEAEQAFIVFCRGILEAVAHEVAAVKRQ